MKRMLVHLKVAADLPVDVFAVTLSVICNPGLFGFLFERVPHRVFLFTLICFAVCVFLCILVCICVSHQSNLLFVLLCFLFYYNPLI